MARSRSTDQPQTAPQAHPQAHPQVHPQVHPQQGHSGQPPHPGQPMGPQFVVQPPQAPRKNFFARHKIITALLVIGVLAAISQGMSGGDEPTTTPAAGGSTTPAAGDTPAEVPAADPAAPSIGTAVADGKLEFTVTSLEPGVSHIGSDTFGVDAQGQFLLVHVTVKNIGDEAQYFDSSSQKLLDAQGRTHSADSSAAIYLPDSNSFLTSINPGNTVDGIVVFDIPADATAASIELHDSPFSGGVAVTLS